MALKFVLVKELPQNFQDIDAVVLTSDLKLLGIHDVNHKLHITSLRTKAISHLILPDVFAFAWQDDNLDHDVYKLLVVNSHNEIIHYVIHVSHSENKILLTVQNASKWSIKCVCASFQELGKIVENVTSIEILKFESSEAVFFVNKRVIISLYPISNGSPQLLSFSDLSEDSPLHRKAILVKQTLFALNEAGTELCIYSFTTNTKKCDIKFSEFNLKINETGVVRNFTVNIKLNLLVFITENGYMYSMGLNLNKMDAQCPQSSKMVTAFAKQFPSVNKLNDSLRRSSMLGTSLQSIGLPFNVKNSLLKNFMLLENKLFFVFQNASSLIVGIHMLDMDDTTIYKELPYMGYVIVAGSEAMPFPVLFFHESKISLVMYDIEQDKLVNELMIYPNSSAVESLASLNNWMNIQMDIEVLRLGLSNRQLYTVEFYLKTLFDGFCQQWNKQPSENWIEKMNDIRSLWEKIMDMLLSTIKENFVVRYYLQFAEHLLQISINVIIQILSIVEDKFVDIDDRAAYEQKEAILEQFSAFLQQMRKQLHNSSTSDIAEECDLSDACIYRDAKILDQWKEWEVLQNDEVMQQAILNQMILVAQAYFLFHENDKTKSSFEEFRTSSQDFVINFLRQGHTKEAIVILLNMGMDVASNLLQIFRSTAEKDVRAVVLAEIQKRKLLKETDKKSLQFLSLLESLHPCTSFAHAQALLNEKCMLSNDHKICDSDSKESLPVGDFIEFNQDNNENGAYCRVVLDWLSGWDLETKGRVIAPHMVNGSPVLDSFSKEGESAIEICPQSLWCHLLENGNIPHLVKWIQCWLESKDHSSESVFYKWPLNEDMINVIPERAPYHVAEVLLNLLAKHGIFCEDELEDIASFLRRTGQAQCDVSDISVFTSEKSSVPFPDLCHRIFHYCLKHNLIQFLYYFVVQNCDKFSVWPKCHLCDVPTLNLTMAYALWTQNHDDTRLAFDALAGTARYICNLPKPTPDEILLGIPVPLSVMILLFSSKPLREVIDEVCKKLDADAVQAITKKFQAYPLLYNFLFKSENERLQSDITMYELLKGNTAFDTTQLFGWQSTNAFRSEDSQNELPHFSLPNLSEQYGLKKELTYIYYLMEGRPNYSYLKFLSREMSSESGLTVSRIRSACREVTEYALCHFNDSKITSACVSFIEIIGQDSMALRTCLIAANLLNESELMRMDYSNKTSSEIGRMFHQATTNKDLATTLVTDLENLIISKWNPFETQPSALFDDIILWMPVMQLSHLYSIECGNVYLNECAKQNNWLKLLTFAQIFQMPKEQVLKATSNFSDSCISYHLFHALHRQPSWLYSAAQVSKRASPPMPKKDTRKSLYSRIGVMKKPQMRKEIKAETESGDEVSSVCSEGTSSSSDVDLGSVILKDLFSQLLIAHKTDMPAATLLSTSFEIKNPVLALLAASYQESQLENCFFVWLYTSLCHDRSTCEKVEQLFGQKKIISCNNVELESLILFAVRSHKILLLWQAVHFFIPESPLMPLAEFLRNFLVYKKFDSSIEHFQNKLWDYPKAQEGASLLNNLPWIEITSVRILEEAVICCSTNYERQILLRHFALMRVEKSFSEEVKVPSFARVSEMMQHISTTTHCINIDKLLHPENEEHYKCACWDIVRELLRNHQYGDARMFADAARLSLVEMVLLQINQETEEESQSIAWNDLSHRVEYWKKVLNKFKQNSVHEPIIVDFLESQCEVSERYGEKYFLMKSIIDVLTENEPEQYNATELKKYDINSLKMRMWLWCIKAEMNGELLPEVFNLIPLQGFNLQDIGFESKEVICQLSNEKEKEALESIIKRLLSNKDLQQSFRLANTFGYKCLNLRIISYCVQLACDEVISEDVMNISEPDQPLEISSFRIMSSLVFWVKEYSSLSLLQKEIVQCMEKLSRKTDVAKIICYQILVHYVIAAVLHCNYISIAQEKDIFVTLKRLLLLNLADEHVLAKCLIVVHELPDESVAKFLSKEIWNSVRVLSESDAVLLPEEKPDVPENIIYDPSKGFQLIVKLCQDPSILGNKLMNIYMREVSELSLMNNENVFLSFVHLCVCAHECFTAACSMEGISQILHVSQQFITLLTEAKKFSVVVELLTAIGRYSEMMYVFDILRKYDKFNLLFEKNLEKVPNLRLALLDYFKRCPVSEADTYFYSIASKFGMHREKAEILEMSAQKQLSHLCKRKMDQDLKEELETAMEDLANAAKSYCKADCLHQAQMCAELAQLVALQIYLVPSGLWIIGLDETSVSRFITEHTKFSQAFIIAEAYKNHQSWSHAIFHNVVMRGDRDYLREYQAHFGISTSLIVDVVKRFHQTSSKTESLTRNMKLLLSLCPNVKAKYNLATELSFNDMASELLMGEGSSYLQDLIATNYIKK